MPNFTLLDISRPEIASLLAAMLQARAAVERRSWWHPQEPAGEEWWADVLADPRARKRDRRVDMALKQGPLADTGISYHRLSDDPPLCRRIPGGSYLGCDIEEKTEAVGWASEGQMKTEWIVFCKNG
jgi:hypothetical protein